MKSINVRVAHLEALRERTGPKHGCVFASIEDARAAGATGGILIISAVMGVAEWNEMAAAQQAQLVFDTQQIHQPYIGT